MDIGLFLKEQKEICLKGNLYHYTQINMAYNSNRIEGSSLTEDETRYIYETNTIGLTNNKDAIKVDDVIETVNHFKLFDYMLETYNQSLNADMIKHFHYLIKRGTSQERLSWFKVGEYKMLANEVGDISTADPSEVADKMDSLLQQYNKIENPNIEDIIAFHYNFERIHPFQDGNGRVGRMIMFKECLKNGITPFIIDEKHKGYYYRGLREFSKVKGYLIDTCLSAQDNYTLVVDKFTQGLEQIQQPQKKKSKAR